MNKLVSLVPAPLRHGLVPCCLVALAVSALADGPKKVSEKSKFPGEEGPELYIENLPIAERLQQAPQARSLPALAQPASDAKGNTDGVSPARPWTAIGPFPIPNGQTEPLVNGIPTNPVPVSGRVTVIDIHPTNPDIAYVGTAQGGLYRTLNGGASWTPLMDNAAIPLAGTPLAIGAIAISPVNPNTVFVGTGEGNLSAEASTGTITLDDESTLTYTAELATGLAGLYDVTISEEGGVSGTSETGGFLEGQLGEEEQRNEEELRPIRGYFTSAEGQEARFEVLGREPEPEEYLWIVLEDGRVKGAEKRAAGGFLGVHRRSRGLVGRARLEQDAP
jgi:hypothetical protein